MTIDRGEVWSFSILGKANAKQKDLAYLQQAGNPNDKKYIDEFLW